MLSVFNHSCDGPLGVEVKSSVTTAFLRALVLHLAASFAHGDLSDRIESHNLFVKVALQHCYISHNAYRAAYNVENRCSFIGVCQLDSTTPLVWRNVRHEDVTRRYAYGTDGACARYWE